MNMHEELGEYEGDREMHSLWRVSRGFYGDFLFFYNNSISLERAVGAGFWGRDEGVEERRAGA